MAVKLVERGYSRLVERSGMLRTGFLGRETGDAGKDDERIEASTARVLLLEIDTLRSFLYSRIHSEDHAGI